jgi:anti-sigma B factor antagonist
MGVCVRRSPPGHTYRMDLLLHHEPPATRVEVVGELDAASAPALRDTVRKTLEPAPERLVVDLGGVTFMDSMGLAAVLAAARAAAAEGVGFGVLSPPGSEARLLIELAGVQGPLVLDR